MGAHTDGLGFGQADSAFHAVESIGLDPTNDQLVYLVADGGGKGRGMLYSN